MKRAILYPSIGIVAICFVAMLALSAYACIRPLTAKSQAAAVADAKLRSLGHGEFVYHDTYFLGHTAYKSVYLHGSQPVSVYVRDGQVTCVLGVSQ